MWNKLTKIKDQNCIHGCSFPLERGGFSVADQSAGKHWEQQSWVTFVVPRSWWCVVCVSALKLPPFLHILCSGEASWHRPAWAMPCSTQSSQQQWGTQMFPGVAAKSPDAECCAARRRLVTCLRGSFSPLTPPVLKSSLLFVRAAMLQEA